VEQVFERFLHSAKRAIDTSMTTCDDGAVG